MDPFHLHQFRRFSINTAQFTPLRILFQWRWARANRIQG